MQVEVGAPVKTLITVAGKEGVGECWVGEECSSSYFFQFLITCKKYIYIFEGPA